MKGSAASSSSKAAGSSSPQLETSRFRLVAPSIALDLRVNAARPDIADITLADRLFASHYAQPAPHGCIVASVPLRSAPSVQAATVSELILGEEFAVVDIEGGWAWGYCCHDRYVGYLPLEALGPTTTPSHVVDAPAALRFARPDIKAPLVDRLPMGARLSGTEAGEFLETTGGFVHLRHVRQIGGGASDPVTIAERLVGAPYRWGGRSGDGLDCSGLVQLALGLAGIAAPRDSDQQAAAAGRPIAKNAPLTRGDLIFFPGHVGLMVDELRIIHANAFWMAVMTEPLADVVARLAPIHVEPISARRRLSA